jgi:predicted metalloendopeptidase
VIAFETRLASKSLSREDLQRKVALYYNAISPAEADKLTPGFSWDAFFKSQGIATPKMFSFPMTDFHAEWNKMRSDVPVEQWKSYLRFHIVDEASPFLSDKFVQENFRFYGQEFSGQKEIKPRWKRVLGTINEQSGEALGQLYVQTAFPAESKARMEKLVQNLRDALKGRIENLSWMSPETKKKALEKWSAFTPKIGYPDKWRSWEGLQTSRDSFFANVLAANRMGHDAADDQRVLQPVPQRNRVPGRDPAAAVLRREGRRRHQLRRHRRGDRPRDDPWLRRSGRAVRPDRQHGKLVDRYRQERLRAADGHARRPVQRLSGDEGQDGQRPPHAR